MLKKSHYRALGLVGLLVFILVFCLPSHTTGQLKLALGSLFLPLFGLSRTTSNLANQAGDALTPRAELVREIERLRRTNQVLQIQASQSESALLENEKFRRYFNWQSQSPWKNRLRLAKVVARDPANWWQTIQIDVGSRNPGIKEDLAVLADSGQLIGRVMSVGLTRSQVILISNPGCKVSAVIEKTREMGVITGSSSPVNNSLVNLSYLSTSSNLKPGQWVLSSGQGGIFPGGIIIGQIAENPRQVDFGLMTEARVKLSANLSALDEVWVLLPQ